VNLSLFPKNDDWGTGDEAQDLRLNQSLKHAAENLSLKSISEFFSFAYSLKTRAYNPSFFVTIELVTKALLYYFSPEENNDELYKKMRGHYFEKEKVVFDWIQASTVVAELKKNKTYRYMNKIDFSLRVQDPHERNPFVEGTMKRSAAVLSAKIIFKEYKMLLHGTGKTDDELSAALQGGGKILFIENFGEIWFHDQEINCLINS
jgi:hypothetical protein